MSKERYARVIKERLVSLSTQSEYERAVLEWAYNGECHAQGGYCELCGKDPIKYVFAIHNSANDTSLRVGSECIVNYAIAGSWQVKEDRKRLEKEAKIERDEALLRSAAEKSPWIKKHLADFLKGLYRYGSLTKRIKEICENALKENKVAPPTTERPVPETDT